MSTFETPAFVPGPFIYLIRKIDLITEIMKDRTIDEMPDIKIKQKIKEKLSNREKNR